MINILGKTAFWGLVACAVAYPFIIEDSQITQVSVKPAVKPEKVETSTKPKPKPQQPKKVVIENEYLPKFAEIRDVKQKKKAFFSYLKPYVEQVNLEIRSKRSFVDGFDDWPTESQDLTRLHQIAKQFRVSIDGEFEQVKVNLLLRADELPVELVLMQAANESAWGTSRFAIQANNLFGQWCFKAGCGVVPEGRPAGKTYEVRKFNKPVDSIRSYFHNLNTGHAYGELRELRQALRNIQEELDPNVIAEGLTPYSIRREAYVEEIQNMIRVNQKYI